jgi:hypothetical protein
MPFENIPMEFHRDVFYADKTILGCYNTEKETKG